MSSNIYFFRDEYEPWEIMQRIRVKHYRTTDHPIVSNLLSETEITEEDLDQGKEEFLATLQRKVVRDQYQEFLEDLLEEFGEKGDRVNLQYHKGSDLSYDQLKEEVEDRVRDADPEELVGEPLEDKVVDCDSDPENQTIDICFSLQDFEAAYEVQDISNFDLSQFDLSPDESLVFRNEYNAEVRAYIEEDFIAVSNSQLSDSVQNRIRDIVADWAGGSVDSSFQLDEIELLVLQNLMDGENSGLDFGEFRDEKLKTAKYRGDRDQAISQSPVLSPAQDAGRITQVRFYYEYSDNSSSRSVQVRIYDDAHITTSKPTQPDFADIFTDHLTTILEYRDFWKSLNYRIRQFIDEKFRKELHGGERSYHSDTTQAFGRLVDNLITEDDYEPVERRAYKAVIANIGAALIECDLSDDQYPSVDDADSRPKKERELQNFFNDLCEYVIDCSYPDFDELWNHMYYILHRPHESPVDVVETAVTEYDL